MAETNYKTGLEFVVGGNAAESIGRISGAADRLSGRMNVATRSMLAFGAGAVGLGLGFRSLGHQVIEANTELEKIQKQVTGTLFAFQTWKRGVGPMAAYTQSVEDAEEVTRRLEETEERLALNLPDIAAGYNMLAGPVIGRLGKGREELLKLTEQVSEASVVFQQAPAQTAQALARILETGKLPERSVDPFVVHMRQALGKIKGMSREKIFGKIEQELKSLGPVAEKMATGFTAQWFRLKDFVGDTVRDLGSPVFKYVTEQAERFRKFLSQQVGEGKTLGQLYGDKILNGFKKLEQVAQKVVSHWKEFALIWGGLNLASGAQGLAAKAGTGLLGSLLGPVGGFTSQLALATAGLAAFYIAANEFSDWASKRQIEQTSKAKGVETIGAFLSQGNLRGAYKALEGMGLAEKGQVNTDKVAVALKGLSEKEQGRLADTLGVGEKARYSTSNRYGTFSGVQTDVIAQEFSKRIATMPKMPETFAGQIKPELATKGKVIQNFYGGIKIDQDFKDADPDRIWVSFKEGLEKQADRRLQASSADPFSM